MSFKPRSCIVRVWTSENNKEFPGNNVGHVSIQTLADPNEPGDQGFYMSLWPEESWSPTQEQRARYQGANPLARKKLQAFMPRPADYHQDLEKDIEAEGGVGPQVTVCLYSLDVHAMNLKFAQLSKNTREWRLAGSNLLIEQLQKVSNAEHPGGRGKNPKLFGDPEPPRESCASLALKILKAGGISKLVNLATYSSFTTKTSTIVRPDEIVNVLKPAKLRELQNPAIAKLECPGETEFEQPQNPNGCMIL